MRLWPFLALALAGCPGDDVADDADTESDAQPDGSFAQVEALFLRSCTTVGCHGEPELATGLDLSAGKAHGQLVDAPAVLAPSLVRVKPGSLEESFLWYKVTGTSAEVGDTNGENMPPPFGLAGTDLEILESWILAGAPR